MDTDNFDFLNGYDPNESLILISENDCNRTSEEDEEYDKYYENEMELEYIQKPRYDYFDILRLKDHFNETNCLKFKIWFANHFLGINVSDDTARTLYPWDNDKTLQIIDKALFYCYEEFQMRMWGGLHDDFFETYNWLLQLARLPIDKNFPNG